MQAGAGVGGTRGYIEQEGIFLLRLFLRLGAGDAVADVDGAVRLLLAEALVVAQRLLGRPQREPSSLPVLS